MNPVSRKIIGMLFPLLLSFGCMKSQHDDHAPPEDGAVIPPPLVEKPAPLPVTTHSFRLATPKTSDSSNTVTLSDIKSQINAACKSCHLAPGSNLGGFTYADAMHTQKLIMNEQQVDVPGFYESAERMRDALVNGSMPPANIRDQSPETYKALGDLLTRWIDTGRQEQSAAGSGNGEYPALWGKLDGQQFSDLGNAVPEAKAIGTDTNTDYFFDQAEQLPDTLAETDLYSMDSLQLAARGTIAYNVEYPLWNDHVQKLRHIHVPAIINQGKTFKPKPLVIQRTDRNSEPTFIIPENTRTYKTFFRGVKENDGSVRYMPVETRLIVTRYSPRKPLFGTYIWKADGSEARLLTTPYRDGTAWKDLTISLDFNHQTDSKRDYVVPARHRCEQCHSGAANDSFVLGFTPLQLNRRDLGEAGRDQSVGIDEMTQVKRLTDYGLISERDAAQLPKLEYFPANRILDDHTMRAQGYMVGNCAHCHNPKGFAKLQGEIPLDFSAGRIFNFDTFSTSKSFSNKKIVHHLGDLAQSYLFHRVASSDTELRSEARMPLHSLASPDCRAVNVMARWIKTYDPLMSNYDINHFDSGKACNKEDDYSTGDTKMIEQDPTDAGGPYKPRREDWSDTKNGMGEWFRGLRFSDPLHTMSSQKYAVDWWQNKPDLCTFPDVTLDPSQIKEWMVKADKVTPVKPFGQLYWTTPGAYFYNLTCTKCHGRLGLADGPIAADLDKWSGGSIRVANFAKGMFGGDGTNILEFHRDGQDYSGNYFIWMALEGTKMNPPPQVADLIGANKAQMLKVIVDRCARLIPSNPKTSKSRDLDLFKEVCTYDNLPITDASVQYDLETGKPVNQAALDAWLKKAAANSGWMIYDYVKSQLAKGTQQFPQSECEAVFKK